MSGSKFREFPGCVAEMKDLHNLSVFANLVIDHDGAMDWLAHPVTFLDRAPHPWKASQ